MSTAEVVEARQWADSMIKWEGRGPGDTDNAMRRIARRYGLEYGALWSLRYRLPKRIWADVHTAIRSAYEAERERQMRALQHDIEITARVAGNNHSTVVKARAILGAYNALNEEAK